MLIIFQAQRKMFGGKRTESRMRTRKIHNAELKNLYCQENIMRAIKSWSLRWTQNAAFMEEIRNVYKILSPKTLK
jgi:hypothetical protein